MVQKWKFITTQSFFLSKMPGGMWALYPCRHGTYAEAILKKCNSFRSEPILNVSWTNLARRFDQTYFILPIVVWIILIPYNSFFGCLYFGLVQDSFTDLGKSSIECDHPQIWGWRLTDGWPLYLIMCYLVIMLSKCRDSLTEPIQNTMKPGYNRDLFYWSDKLTRSDLSAW